jgi:hypothetical protein
MDKESSLLLMSRMMTEQEVDVKYNEILGLKGLPSGAKTEPDLLVILGEDVKSTLGFLPWQIRLTEIQ